MKESPLFWPVTFKRGALFILDETRLPGRLVYLRVASSAQAVDCIRRMKTRAFGQLLVVLNVFLLEIEKSLRPDALSESRLLRRLKQTARRLNASRPTFPFGEVTGMVIAWAQAAQKQGQPVAQVVRRNIQGYLDGIRARRLDRVKRIARLIKSGDTVLTHCNVSGELAMAAALCRAAEKKVRFMITETRPYFQGSKLTYWELSRAGADVTLIADNAAATVMSEGLVNKVIVGSDRNCANGDFANKIGTYQLAVLAKEFGIPFYVLTQPSRRLKSAKDIPVEIRPEKELLTFCGRKIVKGRVKGFYPAFDIVPAKYVTRTIPIDVR